MKSHVQSLLASVWKEMFASEFSCFNCESTCRTSGRILTKIPVTSDREIHVKVGLRWIEALKTSDFYF